MFKTDERELQNAGICQVWGTDRLCASMCTRVPMLVTSLIQPPV